MDRTELGQWIPLDTDQPIWSRFFTVAPLVLIGTREEKGYNLAPKHMAMPLGWENYFGFMCTPRHGTYRNIRREGGFTVSFPRPDQVLLTSLSAMARRDDCDLPKPVLDALPTLPGTRIDAPLLENAYLHLECTLDRIIDGFGENSLIAGSIVHANVHADALRTSDRDEQEQLFHHPLLAFLPYGRFAEIRETLAFPYPKEFKR